MRIVRKTGEQRYAQPLSGGIGVAHDARQSSDGKYAARTFTPKNRRNRLMLTPLMRDFCSGLTEFGRAGDRARLGAGRPAAPNDEDLAKWSFSMQEADNNSSTTILT